MINLGYIGSALGVLRKMSIPVVEMSSTTVNLTRLPNNPLWNNTVNTKPDLEFRGYELVHAVIKADFLNQVNPLMPGLGFILHSHHVIDWQSRELRLRRGSLGMLSDFVETGLAGRVGQGLAILFAHKEGFAFQGHLRSILTSQGISVAHTDSVADFVSESGAQAGVPVRCLVEAKGSFKQPTNCPKLTKSLFKEALNDQVIPWMGRLVPPATKSIVVASYLREDGATGADPSVLAFVDPSDTSPPGDIVLTSEDLRRENYAAWLSAMGLGASAKRLLKSISGEPSSHTFLVIECGQLEIAFYCPCIEAWSLWPHPRLANIRNRMLSIGIEVETLRAISKAILGQGSALADLEPLSEPYQAHTEDCFYSIFPDKTFLGSLEGCRVKTLIEVDL